MNYKPAYKYLPPISWPILTPCYDFLCTMAGFGSGFKAKVLNSIQLAAGTVVADIGCGTGVFLKIAKQKYPNVNFIGIDPDKQALSIAERRMERSNLSVELRESFAESLPLADQSTDVCFSTLAFHHMPDSIKKAAIQEIYRVLKNGGKIVIADFGQTESRLLRKILFFEKPEYFEGNLKGLIPEYLKENSFRNIKIVDHHFPSIDIIAAEK